MTIAQKAVILGLMVFVFGLNFGMLVAARAFAEKMPMNSGIVAVHEPSCDERLREALKAVGPYLDWTPPPASMTLEYQAMDERSRLERRLAELERREQVQAQYEAALKQCGR